MLTQVFGSQFFAKALIVLALILIAHFILKPVKSASHLALRRLGMMLFIVFAIGAVLAPQILTKIAWQLNIGRGTDLLVYGLVLAFFSSLVTSYRRDLAAEEKFTKLARQVALASVIYPSEAPHTPIGTDQNSLGGSEVELPSGTSSRKINKLSSAEANRADDANEANSVAKAPGSAVDGGEIA